MKYEELLLYYHFVQTYHTERCNGIQIVLQTISSLGVFVLFLLKLWILWSLSQCTCETLAYKSHARLCVRFTGIQKKVGHVSSFFNL